MARKKKKQKKQVTVKIKITKRLLITLLILIVCILVGTCSYSYIKFEDPLYIFKGIYNELTEPLVPQVDENSNQQDNSANLPSDAPRIELDTKDYGPLPDGLLTPDAKYKPGYAVLSREAYFGPKKEQLETQVGSKLRSTLNTILTTNIKYYSYGDARYILTYTDEHITKEGTLYGMYDGTEVKNTWDGGSTWSREHVWPCSKMRIPPHDGDDYRPGSSTKDHRSDLHNLRAIKASTNSSRNDKYYDEITTDLTYFPNSGTNPEDDFRGDAARILFYMATMYPQLSLVEEPTKAGMQMGKLSLLLKWNEEDPVDNFERRRNNRVFEYQGNRNPFIDYPELARRAFAYN